VGLIQSTKAPKIKEAWPFYRTIPGVRLCWELEEPKGPKGPLALALSLFLSFAIKMLGPYNATLWSAYRVAVLILVKGSANPRPV
jgi:hypothetical protein